MLDTLPIDILLHIVNYLDCKTTYNLLFVKRELNDEFSKGLRERFYYRAVQKLINQDFRKFKEEIQSINQEGLEKVFFHALNNIDIVWMNKGQGFSEMKYICECMIRGCRITDARILMNSNVRHFYEYFYHVLVNAIGTLNENEREQIQKNINNCRMLKVLHSNFVPFHKEKTNY